ncbi:MAG: hypothetical protein ACLUOI_32080 [Eisenbergiella sp.]
MGGEGAKQQHMVGGGEIKPNNGSRMSLYVPIKGIRLEDIFITAQEVLKQEIQLSESIKLRKSRLGEEKSVKPVWVTSTDVNK